MELRKTLVISAYPCCGKSYLKEHGLRNYSILDSDSSKFSWIERPYTEKELDGVLSLFNTTGNLLPVESIKNIYRKETRKVRNPNFVEDYINHIKNMINEWIGRMYLRGSTNEFIDKQIEMWDKNVGNIDNEPHGKFVYRLNVNGGYIGSIVEDIIEDNNLY